MPQIRTTRTPAKRTQFLARLADCGSIAAAARDCGLPRQTLYDGRAKDPAFAAAWDRAREIGLDALEDEAIRRAVDGVSQPVFSAGLQCGTVRKYSDLLLMFLLKHRRPHQYGDPLPPAPQPAPLTITLEPPP
jgi:hypothetical protein